MASSPLTLARPAIAGLYALTPDLLDTDVLAERVASRVADHSEFEWRIFGGTSS